MQVEFSSVLQAARLTLLVPREAARRIIAMQLPDSVGWLGMALAVVLSSLLTVISSKMSPYGVDPSLGVLFASPARLVFIQALLMLMALALIMGIGKFMGGTGRFADALVLVAWLEAVLILIQIVQILFLLISPQIAVLLGLFSFAVFMWVLANFIAELHGFASGLKVLGMILLTFILVSFVLALLGVGLPAGAANV